MITMCPRGDLNPQFGEISLDLDLNSKTGEKSPGQGDHAAEPTPLDRHSNRSRTRRPRPQATVSDRQPDSGDAGSALSICTAAGINRVIRFRTQIEPIWRRRPLDDPRPYD